MIYWKWIVANAFQMRFCISNRIVCLSLPTAVGLSIHWSFTHKLHNCENQGFFFKTSNGGYNDANSEIYLIDFTDKSLEEQLTAKMSAKEKEAQELKETLESIIIIIIIIIIKMFLRIYDKHKSWHCLCCARNVLDIHPRYHSLQGPSRQPS